VSARVGPHTVRLAKRFFANRATFVAIAVVSQILFIVLAILFFMDKFYVVYAIGVLLSLGAVVWILNSRSNPAYKIAWIIPILLFPVFGGLFYLFFGRIRPHPRMKARNDEISARSKRAFEIVASQREIPTLNDPVAARQSKYLSTCAMSPLWTHTMSRYLPTAEIGFDSMLDALKKAEKYIFLEYFIVAEGFMWDSVYEILKEKAKSGLDVRLIYDDFGSISTLPPGFNKELEKQGIRCAVFNPLKPVLSSDFNHRDHRKIAIIDGRIGFTGGFNLADEYINKIERFGHWHDSGIMIEGDAVANLVVMFLAQWDYLRGETKEYSDYFSRETAPTSDGFVQPFSDNPIDDEPTGESAYLGLIGAATEYLYITTPYLILDSEMQTTLELAARGGVDVRIITPHVPDKWYVHAVTRANYRVLIESGIKIYEYTPGFIHAKSFVTDDRYGVVGTINLDYRSLFLHFECGVWICRTSSVIAMRDDFLAVLSECSGVTIEELDHEPLRKKAAGWFFRIFSPLM
jgi:cardiolipin synthase